METGGCLSKGDKASRRSPRRQKKTCGRPFTAPRTSKSPKTVSKEKTIEAQLVQEDGLDTQDSWCSLDSLPDCLKSPVQSEGRVPGEIVIDKVRDYVIERQPLEAQQRRSSLD